MAAADIVVPITQTQNQGYRLAFDHHGDYLSRAYRRFYTNPS